MKGIHREVPCTAGNRTKSNHTTIIISTFNTKMFPCNTNRAGTDVATLPPVEVEVIPVVFMAVEVITNYRAISLLRFL